MNVQQIKEEITEYFSDLSRSQDETLEGLGDIVEHAQSLYQTVGDDMGGN